MAAAERALDLAVREERQTGGSTLTAQQPDNNVVRVAMDFLSKLSAAAPFFSMKRVPSKRSTMPAESARIALRTQEAIA